MLWLPSPAKALFVQLWLRQDGGLNSEGPAWYDSIIRACAQMRGRNPADTVIKGERCIRVRVSKREKSRDKKHTTVRIESAYLKHLILNLISLHLCYGVLVLFV